MVHQYTKFHCYRMHHKQVISTNTFYKFLFPEAVCCCLQTCNVYILIRMMGCIICVQSFITLGISFTELAHFICSYHNVWPGAIFFGYL